MFVSQLAYRFSDLRRRISPSSREVFNEYRKGLDFRRNTCAWDDEQKRDSVIAQLRRVVRYAGANCQYYSELFRNVGFDPESDFSFSDYSQLPILTRSDIEEAGEGILTSTIPKSRLVKDATGGSTGAPLVYYLGPEELGWRESGTQYSFERIGIERGARLAYFWGHHLDPKATDGFRQRIRSKILNEQWYDCFRLGPEIFKEYHERFQEWQPDCIIAYAGALGSFADFLDENGISVKTYPRSSFVTGAEKLYPKQRETIEKVFGKPVHERYGGRDFGGIAINLSPWDSHELSVDWAWAMIEPETSDHLSNILVTKLHADGMPMVRYRNDDMARFPDSCSPGTPTFTLTEVVGRSLDRIWLPSGKWIHGTEFPHMLKDFPVLEFNITQYEDLKLEIQIVAKDAFSSLDKQNIVAIVQSNVEGLSVEVKMVSEIYKSVANKHRPVISMVNR